MFKKHLICLAVVNMFKNLQKICKFKSKMIFTLAEIALSITWHVGTFTLRLMYNGLYYLYYGNQPSTEELSRQELEERIHDLENKMEEFGNSKNEVKPEDEKNK